MNEDKLNEFLGKFVTDLGATVAAGNVVIGHRLGLYRALASGPATPEQLAERTGTAPRYIAEWLRGQVAGGYVTWDAAQDRYSLTEEQAFVLYPAPGDRGGLHQVPPRRRDPVQPGLRGAAMITVIRRIAAAGQLVARLSAVRRR